MTSNSPINGQRWSNAVFTVTGKAGDNVAMAAVYVHSSASGACPTLSITNPVASQIFTQSPINAGGTKAGAAFCQSPQMKNSWFENYATEQRGGLASGQPFG
jgi:hypothetical protein